MKIKPHTMPRNAWDVLIGLALVVPLYLPMFLLPSVLVGWFFHSEIAGVAMFLAISLLFLSFTVWSLDVSGDGIRFVRLLGTPKFLSWDEIIDIAEAPRRELVLHGWLWPLFPPREASVSLSAARHFRIRWNDGFTYFPPTFPDEFLRDVEMFRGAQTTMQT